MGESARRQEPDISDSDSEHGGALPSTISAHVAKGKASKPKKPKKRRAPGAVLAAVPEPNASVATSEGGITTPGGAHETPKGPETKSNSHIVVVSEDVAQMKATID